MCMIMQQLLFALALGSVRGARKSLKAGRLFLGHRAKSAQPHEYAAVGGCARKRLRKLLKAKGALGSQLPQKQNPRPPGLGITTGGRWNMGMGSCRSRVGCSAVRLLTSLEIAGAARDAGKSTGQQAMALPRKERFGVLNMHYYNIGVNVASQPASRTSEGTWTAMKNRERSLDEFIIEAV